MPFPTSKTTHKTSFTVNEPVSTAHTSEHNAVAESVNALQDKVGINGSADNITHDYKLSGVTGSDKAVSKTGTETLTNKTISTGSSLDTNATLNAVNITLGSDAEGDTYYRNASGKLTRLPKGTNGQVLRMGASVPEWGTLSSGAVTANFTAGEAITGGNAVRISDGTATGILISQLTTTSNETAASSSTIWYAQSFVTGSSQTRITAVDLYFHQDAAGDNYGISIRSSLTGSDLGFVNNISTTVTPQFRTATFGTPITVTPSTTYYIIFQGNQSGASDNWLIYGTAATSYADGSAFRSANDGGSWGAAPTLADLAFRVYGPTETVGNIYKASASTTSVAQFIGFAPSSISSGATGSVTVGGIVTGLSGLTPGTHYFVSNTAGAIQTTAGTNSKKVGIALSTTTLLIKNENA